MTARGIRHPAAITGIVLAGMLVLCCGVSGVLGATGVLDTADPSPRHHTPHIATSTAPVTGSPVATPTSRPITDTDAVSATTALAALAKLPIKAAASMAGYSREAFGAAWADVDHNGCDTRNDILRRDLTGITVDADGCTVLSGRLADPYTDTTVAFRRGHAASGDAGLDHLVALGDAWRTGAQNLSASRRERLANDPLDLLAADGPTIASKGDLDASRWLPPDRAFDCPYVADQIAVKRAYGLWVTRAEHDTMVSTLRSCGGHGPTRSASAPPTTEAPYNPPRDSEDSDNGDNGGSDDGDDDGGGGAVVHPGAFCSPEGAVGVTSAGTPMVCRSKNGDQPRWRSAG